MAEGASAAAAPEATPFAPGARIEVRDAEWMVRTCVPADAAEDGYMVRAVGLSEFVRGEDAVFFTGLEKRADPSDLGVRQLRPEETELVADDTPRFARSRLFLESVLRRTPLPQSERRLAMTGKFLLDDHVYQQRPAELALKGLRPRILLADVVGLGKTLEIGLTLAELIRRGRGERILVVTPQQVLEQFQQELWTRFAIPLVRLDSVGLERVQRDIPAGRNPFLYYKRAIISVDTLKNQGKYGRHLRSMHWDAVVIDESHNLINEGNLRNELAKLLAAHTDALLLASATPHNGDAASFAQLIRLLDPAAIADPGNYSASDIDHLYIRRTKVNPEVQSEMGDRWPERGPSEPVHCTATPAEERVFAELARTWFGARPLDGGPVVGKERRLFPYTLLKAFLSSHKALASTVDRRLATITDRATGTVTDPADQREHTALRELARLAGAMSDEDSAKLAKLVEQLSGIGVGKRSPTRAVVFSESVPTLKWLRDTVPALLGLGPDQVSLLHGGMSDQQQQHIIDDFSLADSPVRLFLTGDLASEGVNLHRQCHHLVHYDLPWSLIRIEQRNGRIDRYGQQHNPRFKALVLTSATEGAYDDTTVSEKLLAREEQAHRSMGSAEAVAGEYTAKKEEDRLVHDLLSGKTVEESLESAADDPMADFFGGDVGVPEHAAAPEPAPVPRLFDSTEAFVRTALDTVCPELHVDDDGKLLAFEPPKDLANRLSVLPASYLRAHQVTKRMRVTFDAALADAKREEARSTKTSWPEIAYVSDLHPMVEWLVDKVQVEVHRRQAPVVAADVAEPVLLVQGIYSNELGRPTVVRWMAVTGLPDEPRVEDMFDVLDRAGVGPNMNNTGGIGDLEPLRKLVDPAVRTAREHLDGHRADYDSAIAADLAEPERKLEEWRQLSLEGLENSGSEWRARRRRGEVEETVDERQRLMRSMRTVGEPLLRVLAVLKPLKPSG
ncbi:DEAD/DEAH box helicase [Streptomonospora litoralis]|uniref:RNA polymerase-associated protein RapA n=1 Tax=Streptomonospora litoralis TaxID=2498135 RepID=A0A4P6Q7U3_9ACTN|nr:DEAD/DEAH box helicase [Streptomonospora litoralis]QBI56470.1 RNA polymerase-associated protein RapA [Streptomonospora litoralis]